MRIGTPVTFPRRNGETATGTVASAISKSRNGEWISVNTGDKKKPVIARVRPSQLRRA